MFAMSLTRALLACSDTLSHFEGGTEHADLAQDPSALYSLLRALEAVKTQCSRLTPPAAAFGALPLEIMEHILMHLLDHPNIWMALSQTCKHLHGVCEAIARTTFLARFGSRYRASDSEPDGLSLPHALHKPADASWTCCLAQMFVYFVVPHNVWEPHAPLDVRLDMQPDEHARPDPHPAWKLLAYGLCNTRYLPLMQRSIHNSNKIGAPLYDKLWRLGLTRVISDMLLPALYTRDRTVTLIASMINNDDRVSLGVFCPTFHVTDAWHAIVELHAVMGKPLLPVFLRSVSDCKGLIFHMSRGCSTMAHIDLLKMTLSVYGTRFVVPSEVTLIDFWSTGMMYQKLKDNDLFYAYFGVWQDVLGVTRLLNMVCSRSNYGDHGFSSLFHTTDNLEQSWIHAHNFLTHNTSVRLDGGLLLWPMLQWWKQLVWCAQTSMSDDVRAFQHLLDGRGWTLPVNTRGVVCKSLFRMLWCCDKDSYVFTCLLQFVVSKHAQAGCPLLHDDTVSRIVKHLNPCRPMHLDTRQCLQQLLDRHHQKQATNKSVPI